MPVVSALYVYPIKSCRGIRVSEWPVAERGFVADRRWMIRRCRRQIRDAARDPGARAGEHHARGGQHAADGSKTAGSRAAAQLRLGRRTRGPDLERRQAKARSIRKAAPGFSSYLGSAHELVYMPERHRRAVNPKRAQPGDVLGFADGYPFLLISEASLEDLNARLDFFLILQAQPQPRASTEGDRGSRNEARYRLEGPRYQSGPAAKNPRLTVAV